MRTRNYNFDIDKHSLIKPVVIIRSGDHDIDTIRVTLSEQGDPVDLTKATVTFMGTTPAGNKIIDAAHVKIVDATTGIFEYTFPSAAGASVGEYQDAYFSIVMDNGQTSTMNFRIQVLSGVDISAPAASEYITHYDTMVTALNSAYDSATHETNEKMASTVSSLATSAATVLDSALARVNDVDSKANQATSAASNAVSMASSVASTVTSQASYINSVASSAASSVSSVAATVVDKLNNLSIGGRNLLLNSAFLNGFVSWNNENNSWTIDGSTYQGNPIIKSPTTVGSGSRLLQKFANPPAAGSKIMVSFNAKGNDTNSIVVVTLFNGNAVSVPLSSTFKRYTVPLTVPTKFDVPQIYFWNGVDGNNVFLNSIKIEIGNVPTDWTPAPEDADNTYVSKSGDTMTGGLKGGQVDLPASGDLNSLTDTGKYYQNISINTVNWTNRPSNAPSLAFSVDVIGHANKSLVTQVYYVHTTSRMWVRTMWLDGTMQSSNWVELADDASVMHKTGNETAAGDKTFTGKVSVSGELDAAQKIYTRTIGSTNDLQLVYTRVGNLVTGRYRVKFAGTFPLAGNDGYKSNMGESVNVIAAGGVDAWFTNDNKFVAKGGSEGNFVFVTRDPLPSN